MRILLLLTSLLLLTGMCLHKPSSGGGIPWSGQYKLSWEDFKGQPDTIAFKGFKAVTWTRLKSKARIYDDKIEYELTRSFLPERSWQLSFSNTLLQHEQGHFDLAEVFARRIRKALVQHVSTDMKKTCVYIDSVFKHYDHLEQEMTDLYEIETQFSMDSVAQYEWSHKIMKMLQEHEPYADTKCVIRRTRNRK